MCFYYTVDLGKDSLVEKAIWYQYLNKSTFLQEEQKVAGHG